MICHSCDNPSCVCPHHLSPGTALDNKRDSIKRGRHAKGTACHTNKLTEDQVRAILSDPRKGAVIAREYGVTKENIYAIQKRKTWKHLSL
jgi:RNA polymerase subunit RPABC4/transcription elongation factor Spt4